MTERIHAPELSGALDWFNVPAPLTLGALRGKVVIIGGHYLGMNDMHPTPYSSSLAGRDWC